MALRYPELWDHIRKATISVPHRPELTPHHADLLNSGQDAFLMRRIEEYRRFMYLVLATKEKICASDIIDDLWHHHQQTAPDFWEKYVNPRATEIINELLAEHDSGTHNNPQAYERTLMLYAQEFEQEPPADIWPKRKKVYKKSKRPQNEKLKDYRTKEKKGVVPGRMWKQRIFMVAPLLFTVPLLMALLQWWKVPLMEDEIAQLVYGGALVLHLLLWVWLTRGLRYVFVIAILTQLPLLIWTYMLYDKSPESIIPLYMAGSFGAVYLVWVLAHAWYAADMKPGG